MYEFKHTKTKLSKSFWGNQYPSNIICAKYNTFTELNVIMKNFVKEEIPKILYKKNGRKWYTKLKEFGKVALN